MKKNHKENKLKVNKITISRLNESEMHAAFAGFNCPPPTISPYDACNTMVDGCPNTTDQTTTYM